MPIQPKFLSSQLRSSERNTTLKNKKQKWSGIKWYCRYKFHVKIYTFTVCAASSCRESVSNSFYMYPASSHVYYTLYQYLKYHNCKQLTNASRQQSDKNGHKRSLTSAVCRFSTHGDLNILFYPPAICSKQYYITLFLAKLHPYET